jgi:uncharacterized Rossmann fold enzyme
MEGRPFVRNGITLLSGYDPVTRCERIADAVSVKDKTLYFCPSPLYCYGLEKFMSRLDAQAPNSAVLCIEADPELYELTKNSLTSFLSVNKMFRITDICEAADLCAFVRDLWGARAFRRIEIVKFTGGWQLSGSLYDSLFDALRREIAVDWGNAMTLARLGRLYIRNALRNLSLLPHFQSIANLSFGSSPLLVLGAGPSLDETLDALEFHFSGKLHCQDKRPFKIICVDTCLGALKDRNIVPDLVVILESQFWNLRDFTGCKGWNVKSAIDLSAHPASARILSGEGFVFMTPWTSLRIFERLKSSGLCPIVISPLGSVGLTAAEVARRISNGKIIFSGLDFSFTYDKYHARSTPGHRSRLNAQTRMKRIANTAAFDTVSFTAVSKSGFYVKSSPVMRNYRELFEQEFADDTRLFDITGTGLPLGIKTLSYEEAVSVLSGNAEYNIHKSERQVQEKSDKDRALLTEKLKTFINKERKRLIDLRNILTGEAAPDQIRLNSLIEECDYLYAHFPDFAGGKKFVMEEGNVSQNTLSFLKRVRTEIDPMIKLLEKTAELSFN